MSVCCSDPQVALFTYIVVFRKNIMFFFFIVMLVYLVYLAFGLLLEK